MGAGIYSLLSKMLSRFTTFLLFVAIAKVITCQKEAEVVQRARWGLLHAKDWAQASVRLHGLDHGSSSGLSVALADCVKLYGDTDPRLERLASGEEYDGDDAVTWLSAAAASHRSCLDGLEEKGGLFEAQVAQKLTMVLREALAFYGPKRNRWSRNKGVENRQNLAQNEGLMASWNVAVSEADFVVAQDGTGNYMTINKAVAAVAQMGQNRPERVIIYIKTGVYNEKVEINRDMKNVMFIGDGIDKTVITGNDNVQDGATTLSSATFGVSGDGFWARDITFENMAGPQKHQAVALRVSSDLSIFYQCSFKGYQDTLLVHSLRQFYRDCHIYGTIDYIFGDASAVFQNCDIFVSRPMDHQSNMITAQGRDDPNENSGISIVNSRVSAASDFSDVKSRFKTYLGRPWKKYSRTVIIKTDLDGLIDPKGWTGWDGDFALSTLYYGEYMNSGSGASTAYRVNWTGFHVLSDPVVASSFAARNFIQADSWLPTTGVPFWSNI